MTASSAIGVFGGTFDPIHIGHLVVAQDAAVALGLDQVLFVPNHIPPHKRHQHVTGATERSTMVRLAIADNPLFAFSSIELDREGPSYTLDTMRALHAQMPEGTRLVFLTGSDSLLGLHTWHEPEILLNEFDLVFLARPTDSPIDWQSLERRFPAIRDRVRMLAVPQLEISSRELRRRVAANQPIRYYVVPEVERYITQHGLYR